MSTFTLIADLELEVDGYSLVPLSAAISPEFTRSCTLVQLSGGHAIGLGEDVVYQPEDQAAFQKAGAVHDLSGSWTLSELCYRIEALDLFPVPPQSDVSRLYRVWAFESAALDLALRQNEVTPHAALWREPQPMRYVASTRLGEPPSLEPVSKRLALDPGLRFKLERPARGRPS